MIVPEIATIRHPNLLVSANAIGPEKVQIKQAPDSGKMIICLR